MLDYAESITMKPWQMCERDIIALREVGFDDEAILEINLISGYYAFVNRLAAGLGVELEDYWQK